MSGKGKALVYCGHSLVSRRCIHASDRELFTRRDACRCLPPTLYSCAVALISDADRLAHVVADRPVDVFRFATDGDDVRLAPHHNAVLPVVCIHRLTSIYASLVTAGMEKLFRTERLSGGITPLWTVLAEPKRCTGATTGTASLNMGAQALWHFADAADAEAFTVRPDHADTLAMIPVLLNLVWLRQIFFGFIVEDSIVQVVLRNNLKQVTGKLGFVHADGFRPLAQP